MSLPSCTQDARPGETVLTGDDEPQIRIEKILDIRRQLGEGRYNIEDRLDAVIERIIADLT